MRETRGITQPEIIIAETAHASFWKAAKFTRAKYALLPAHRAVPRPLRPPRPASRQTPLFHHQPTPVPPRQIRSVSHTESAPSRRSITPIRAAPPSRTNDDPVMKASRDVALPPSPPLTCAPPPQAHRRARRQEDPQAVVRGRRLPLHRPHRARRRVRTDVPPRCHRRRRRYRARGRPPPRLPPRPCCPSCATCASRSRRSTSPSPA